MKYLLLIILTLLLLATAKNVLADDWSDADKDREVVYLTLRVADWAQTRYIAHHPTAYWEDNGFIGRFPSMGRVNTYFAVTALAHIAIVDMLPSEYRQIFQYITISEAGGYVVSNLSIGIGMDF